MSLELPVEGMGRVCTARDVSRKVPVPQLNVYWNFGVHDCEGEGAIPPIEIDRDSSASPHASYGSSGPRLG